MHCWKLKYSRQESSLDPVEFLNRVDETVLFSPLTKDELKVIADLQLALLQKRLDHRRITLTLSAEAKEYIATAGYDPVYGARPLKRLLQKEVETGLSRKMLAGEITDGDQVIADYMDGKLVFNQD